MKSEQTDELQKLREMIKDLDMCMLTTVDDDGSLRSRPMSNNGEVEFDGDLWFFTYGASHKVDEVKREERVNVSFASPEKSRYISMSGTAELVRDKAKIKELWKPALKAWFPKGLDEPDIALLKVTVEKAEYWDSPGSKIAHMLGFMKALATGTQYDGGENEKIDLK
ncbi:MAG: pyridoxamine 5'-phosphate oxidase family protein [Verrucomicrobiota bacterium]|nr:pyridoxamine 5'-phosphate oxidase family protein [Verrucomicrobiota bacterium]